MFSVIWCFISLWYLFGRHFLGISVQMLSWMMDEFIRWLKPYLLLSTPCDETLSWMMDNFIRWLKPDFLLSTPCDEISTWMVDEFICGPKPYLLLSATCDELLSWRIGFWMKIQLVSDRSCNTVNL